METAAAPAVPRTKTKAKQRYLKKKKERRKLKAKTNKARGVSREPGGTPARGDSSEEESEEDVDAVVEDVRPVVSSPPPERTEERPSKRRRVETEELDRPVADVFQVDEGEIQPDEPEPTQPPVPEKDIDIPVGFLPSFPLPKLPNAPSKATLALQGLDRKLIEAEIVDPSTVLPLPGPDDDDDETKDGDDIRIRLGSKTRKRLAELGITELFAVQTAIVPHLLTGSSSGGGLYRPYDPPYDLCVSAPTGSGKTLAYVLPIVETLQTRVVTRLRALVVLPTRDLVGQVRETFEAISKGTGLKIGSASGQHSFAHEQSQLVYDRTSHLAGGSSKVDILICTPGRLMDHLVGTPNFSLQHLRYLVIDEADRLLAQSFQDWLAQVLAAIRTPKKGTFLDSTTVDNIPSSTSPYTIQPIPDGLAPNTLHQLPIPDIPTFLNEDRASSCQKLLFSATLTRDPGKIAALDLRDPRYIIVQSGKDQSVEENVTQVVLEKFAVPDTLREHMIVVNPSKKPLIMFHLVYSHQVTNALVFTKSAESTTRLLRLFEFFEEARMAAGGEDTSSRIVARAYSSDSPPSERKSILEDFKAQKIHILICSDLISRGIDISHVNHVVSYDAPVDIRKYVHRVGRTARAGREGDAWTLVEEQEAHYFKKMMKEADHLDSVKRLRVAETATAPLEPFYEAALGKLKEVYSR
ncbi:ATP-dependent RNA helicase [Coprinopsis cinerea okayama7|uniref:ATP-dependent RNA helicase n=1 Tax=Coprinopsis cinerea (strain Okayama-7 / 130 / ATCC MYA-4618 / FGSC 9003) TaxID=240176 RepID=A8NUN2_COPC7|nr:ATP-dependent RNA helicase [Coprinopsis cinerea okayama7\|eukprot:XP_001836493.2 ATP-dependent RNA helicase [Coprinopsis cinerea okayama7\